MEQIQSRIQETQSSDDLDQNRQFNDCDPEVILSNLSLLDQRIHQIQAATRAYFANHHHQQLQQQQKSTVANLATIIAQLTAATETLLSSLVTKMDDAGPDDRQQYEVLQLAEDEIMATNAHFCVICGKGFKRDANLRMHMRGHGEEYKSTAALAKPTAGEEGGAWKRYSCPVKGCKRNKEHSKFQPLKTMLCVKNHYKRSHCVKSFTCGRCHSKKFSVVADLKTHEKHCGKDRWICSCGTTFSRKDKLFGHVALFQGHAPAIAPPSSLLLPPETAANEMSSLSPFINFEFLDFDCLDGSFSVLDSFGQMASEGE